MSQILLAQVTGDKIIYCDLYLEFNLKNIVRAIEKKTPILNISECVKVLFQSCAFIHKHMYEGCF